MMLLSGCAQSGGKPDTQNQQDKTAGNDCLKISDTEARDDCYAESGLKAFDIDRCMQVASKVKKERCAHEVALGKGDAALCAYIPSGSCSPEDGDSCISSENCVIAVALKKKEVYDCDNISSASPQRDVCYMKVAPWIMVSEDPWDWCKDIKAQEYKDACYLRGAELTRNTELCEQAGGQRDDCLLMLAEKFGNTNACRRLKDPAAQDACLSSTTDAK